MLRKLFSSKVDDVYTSKSLQALGAFLSSYPFLRGSWSFLTFQVKTSGSAIKIPHNLSYRPLDIILLSTVGGTATFNYTDFDATFISLNATVTSSPMTIRIFIGRYSEDTVNV